MRTPGCHTIKNNMFAMGLPSGRMWPCSLLWGCIGGEAINTASPLLGLCVGPSVCLPAGVSAGLQQHDVSWAPSTRWPLSQPEECLCAPDSRVAAQTMRAGHKHRDLSAEGDALQHVAVQSGMDYQRGVQTDWLVESRALKDTCWQVVQKMESSKWRGTIDTTLSWSV